MPAFIRKENDELEFIRNGLDSLPTALILDVFAHVMSKGISKGIGMILADMERKGIFKGIISKDISKGKGREQGHHQGQGDEMAEACDESEGVGQEAERGSALRLQQLWQLWQLWRLRQL